MQWVVVGGAGFIGTAVRQDLQRRGEATAVIDVCAPPAGYDGAWLRSDLLVDPLCLPAGRVVLAFGQSLPRPVRPWTLVLDNAVTTARLARQLDGREVTLVSTVEVYGPAPGPLREQTPPRLPVSPARLTSWCDRALAHAAEPCPPHRVAALCRELADVDPTGRWTYALSKAAQEEILSRVVAPERLTVLRCANVVGRGQWRVLARMVEAVLGASECQLTDTVRSFVSVEELSRVIVEVRAPGVFNVASGSLPLREVARLVGRELGHRLQVVVVPAPADDSCGVVDASRLSAAAGPLEDVQTGLRRSVRALAEDSAPMFRPTLPVVVPPRPEQPDVVAARISAALWSGRLREGRWGAAFASRVTDYLGLGSDRRVLLTNSGTNALRLAVAAVAGRAAPGSVALCPAYTFHATAEVLRQLGYLVRLVDVDSQTWTLDPAALTRALADQRVRVVVGVDALGNPCHYDRVAAACRQAAVPFVADSAPALGSRYAGAPVGTQADAHAFSLSFAKVVSGGGSGGAVVVSADADDADLGAADNWLRSAAMTEPSAVVALDGFCALDELLDRRQRVADVYAAAFAHQQLLVPQQVRDGDRHSWVHWVARVDPSVGRIHLAAALAAEGVATKTYYEPLAGRAPGAVLPVTDRLHEQVLALPMSSELTVDDAERVAAAVARVLRRTVPTGTVPVNRRDAERTISLPEQGVSAGVRAPA